jgi:hypothetical protein
MACTTGPDTPNSGHGGNIRTKAGGADGGVFVAFRAHALSGMIHEGSCRYPVSELRDDAATVAS